MDVNVNVNVKRGVHLFDDVAAPSQHAGARVCFVRVSGHRGVSGQDRISKYICSHLCLAVRVAARSLRCRKRAMMCVCGVHGGGGKCGRLPRRGRTRALVVCAWTEVSRALEHQRRGRFLRERGKGGR